MNNRFVVAAALNAGTKHEIIKTYTHVRYVRMYKCDTHSLGLGV